MHRHTSSRPAGSAFFSGSAFAAGLVVGVFLLGVVALTLLDLRDGALTLDAEDTALTLAFGAFALVGAAIVLHRPRSAIGWVYAAIGCLAVTSAVADEYAAAAVITGLRWPGFEWAAWYASWAWYALLGLAFIALPLLFPTGRLPGGRWRPFAAGVGALVAFVVVTAALAETVQVGSRGVVLDNPIGLAGLVYVEDLRIWPAVTVAFSVAVLGAASSMVVRFRRSRGSERQQIKAFTWAAGLCAVLQVSWLLPLRVLGDVVFIFQLLLLPVASGVAILRHQLFDIDRVVNRTVVYALVTALLAGVYISLVTAASLLTPAATTSPIAVAASTLAAAALFRPVRARVQLQVDRRFDRARYDAAQVVDGYRAHVRTVVDLDAVVGELVDAATRSVHPTGATLWLRAPRSTR